MNNSKVPQHNKAFPSTEETESLSQSTSSTQEFETPGSESSRSTNRYDLYADKEFVMIPREALETFSNQFSRVKTYPQYENESRRCYFTTPANFVGSVTYTFADRSRSRSEGMYDVTVKRSNSVTGYEFLSKAYDGERLQDSKGKRDTLMSKVQNKRTDIPGSRQQMNVKNDKKVSTHPKNVYKTTARSPTTGTPTPDKMSSPTGRSYGELYSAEKSSNLEVDDDVDTRLSNFLTDNKDEILKFYSSNTGLGCSITDEETFLSEEKMDRTSSYSEDVNIQQFSKDLVENNIRRSMTKLYKAHGLMVDDPGNQRSSLQSCKVPPQSYFPSRFLSDRTSSADSFVMDRRILDKPPIRGHRKVVFRGDRATSSTPLASSEKRNIMDKDNWAHLKRILDKHAFMDSRNIRDTELTVASATAFNWDHQADKYTMLQNMKKQYPSLFSSPPPVSAETPGSDKEKTVIDHDLLSYYKSKIAAISSGSDKEKKSGRPLAVVDMTETTEPYVLPLETEWIDAVKDDPLIDFDEPELMAPPANFKMIETKKPVTTSEWSHLLDRELDMPQPIAKESEMASPIIREKSPTVGKKKNPKTSDTIPGKKRVKILPGAAKEVGRPSTDLKDLKTSPTAPEKHTKAVVQRRMTPFVYSKEVDKLAIVEELSSKNIPPCVVEPTVLPPESRQKPCPAGEKPAVSHSKVIKKQQAPQSVKKTLTPFIVSKKTTTPNPMFQRTSVLRPVSQRTSIPHPMSQRTSVSRPVSQRTYIPHPVSHGKPTSRPVPQRTSILHPVSQRTSVSRPQRTSILHPMPQRTSVSRPVSQRTSILHPVSHGKLTSRPMPQRTSILHPVSQRTSVSRPQRTSILHPVSQRKSISRPVPQRASIRHSDVKMGSVPHLTVKKDVMPSVVIKKASVPNLVVMKGSMPYQAHDSPTDDSDFRRSQRKSLNKVSTMVTTKPQTVHTVDRKPSLHYEEDRHPAVSHVEPKHSNEIHHPVVEQTQMLHGSGLERNTHEPGICDRPCPPQIFIKHPKSRKSRIITMPLPTDANETEILPPVVVEELRESTFDTTRPPEARALPTSNLQDHKLLYANMDSIRDKDGYESFGVSASTSGGNFVKRPQEPAVTLKEGVVDPHHAIAPSDSNQFRLEHGQKIAETDGRLIRIIESDSQHPDLELTTAVHTTDHYPMITEDSRKFSRQYQSAEDHPLKKAEHSPVGDQSTTSYCTQNTIEKATFQTLEKVKHGTEKEEMDLIQFSDDLDGCKNPPVHEGGTVRVCNLPTDDLRDVSGQEAGMKEFDDLASLKTVKLNAGSDYSLEQLFLDAKGSPPRPYEEESGFAKDVRGIQPGSRLNLYCSEHGEGVARSSSALLEGRRRDDKNSIYSVCGKSQENGICLNFLCCNQEELQTRAARIPTYERSRTGFDDLTHDIVPSNSVVGKKSKSVPPEDFGREDRTLRQRGHEKTSERVGGSRAYQKAVNLKFICCKHNTGPTRFGDTHAEAESQYDVDQQATCFICTADINNGQCEQHISKEELDNLHVCCAHRNVTLNYFCCQHDEDGKQTETEWKPRGTNFGDSQAKTVSHLNAKAGGLICRIQEEGNNFEKLQSQDSQKNGVRLHFVCCEHDPPESTLQTCSKIGDSRTDEEDRKYLRASQVTSQEESGGQSAHGSHKKPVSVSFFCIEDDQCARHGQAGSNVSCKYGGFLDDAATAYDRRLWREEPQNVEEKFQQFDADHANNLCFRIQCCEKDNEKNRTSVAEKDSKETTAIYKSRKTNSNNVSRAFGHHVFWEPSRPYHCGNMSHMNTVSDDTVRKVADDHLSWEIRETSAYNLSNKLPNKDNQLVDTNCNKISDSHGEPVDLHNSIESDTDSEYFGFSLAYPSKENGFREQLDRYHSKTRNKSSRKRGTESDKTSNGKVTALPKKRCVWPKNNLTIAEGEMNFMTVYRKEFSFPHGERVQIRISR